MRNFKAMLSMVLVLPAAMICVPTAYADDPSVPPDVVQWFSMNGPSAIGENTDASSDELSFPSQSRLGDIVTVYGWDNSFLSSKSPSAELLVAQPMWSAPVLAGGVARGTLSVIRGSDGVLHWAADDAWWDGELLTAMPKDGRYVNNGRDLSLVMVGTTVRQIRSDAVVGAPRSLASGDYFQTNALTLRDAARLVSAENTELETEAGAPVAGGYTVDLSQFVATYGESTLSGPWWPWAVTGGSAVVALCAIGLAVWQWWKRRR